MKYRFMEEQRVFHSVEKMARILKVSRSGYYAWATRSMSRRSAADTELIAEIRNIQDTEARHRYGSPRMTRALRRRGWTVGHNRVARLMRQGGVNARRRRSFRTTTRSDERQVHAENLLARNFRPERKDQVWATDITYIPTAEGWLYLCVVVDLFSRKIVGWGMSSSVNTDLALAALVMAIVGRRPPKGLMVHSDRGSQFASMRFRGKLAEHGILQSMSRKGDCWDNACVESFFKTLKVELVGSTIYRTRVEAQKAIFEYVEVFYNRVRLHSTIGYLTPEEIEEKAV